ncbi:hypothetical protein AAG570_002459 [Ranatra chinensis]|uniref:ADP-ribosylhydrolase ARH3 n=1 Tax=Ranatra chinensis TaxID=642074 RepID=A0ABD0YW14_9HEMI
MMSASMEGAVIASKFRGALIGALLGDCLGAPFEGDERVSKSVLQKYFDKLEGPHFKAPFKQYTDDTAMTKCVAESLIHSGGFNEEDMAKRFVEEYYRNPKRGYGANVVSIFGKLRSTDLKDVWQPAREQFSGRGSYGNGGAMRVSPIALYCHKNYQQMIDFCGKTTALTHTNTLGINGALLQCIAVHQSLEQSPNDPIDEKKFSFDLISKMSKIEEKSSPEVESKTPYIDQLKLVQKLLEKNKGSTLDDDEEVVESLGNTIAALYSVPTAVYCFLRAQSTIKDMEVDNPFRRTLQYSISLGGDTDTIASMAGAISGAYHGYGMINANVQRHCEGVEKMLDIANELMLVSET